MLASATQCGNDAAVPAVRLPGPGLFGNKSAATLAVSGEEKAALLPLTAGLLHIPSFGVP